MANLDLEALRRQHHDIMVRATSLRGLGDMIQTRDDALEARGAIACVDRVLTCHLRFEDEQLYPALATSGDPVVAAMASDCAEEMGGILGAWEAYRDQWTTPAILANPDRFGVVTAGVIGALAMRIERENRELFPAGEAVVAMLAVDRYAAE